MMENNDSNVNYLHDICKRRESDLNDMNSNKKNYLLPDDLWINNWWYRSTPKKEEQIDQVLKEGLRLICDLISEKKIDSDVAVELLTLFFELYAENRIDFTVNKFLSKRKDRPFINALRHHLEKEYE